MKSYLVLDPSNDPKFFDRVDVMAARKPDDIKVIVHLFRQKLVVVEATPEGVKEMAACRFSVEENSN